MTAYFGLPVVSHNDSHRTTDVRHLLRPLARMAQERNVAVLLVSHLNKTNSAEAMTRVTGSGAFTAQARALLLVGKDSDEAGLRLLVLFKNSVAALAPGVAYQIETVILDSPTRPGRDVAGPSGGWTWRSRPTPTRSCTGRTPLARRHAPRASTRSTCGCDRCSRLARCRANR